MLQDQQCHCTGKRSQPAMRTNWTIFSVYELVMLQNKELLYPSRFCPGLAKSSPCAQHTSSLCRIQKGIAVTDQKYNSCTHKRVHLSSTLQMYSTFSLNESTVCNKVIQNRNNLSKLARNCPSQLGCGLTHQKQSQGTQTPELPHHQGLRQKITVTFNTSQHPASSHVGSTADLSCNFVPAPSRNKNYLKWLIVLSSN